MNKIAFVLSLGVLVYSAPVLAADPTIAGSTQIGRHLSYGSLYSGFWRTGSDYSLLTDGQSTFLNSPSTSGAVYIRQQNQDRAIFTQDMFLLYTDQTIQGSLFTGGGINVLGGPVYAQSELVAIGHTDLRSGLQVQNGVDVLTGNSRFRAGVTAGPGDFDVYPGVFEGQNYGVWVRGATVAMHVEGPIDANSTITVLGDAYKPGGGDWSAVSDRRVKKEVEEFQPGLAEIEQVRTVRYKYNGLAGTLDTNKQYVGVIAQELERVAPFMVASQKKKLHPTDSELSDIKEVDPSAFTYMLVNAVQELSRQNKEMKQALCHAQPKAALCRTAKAVARN